MKKRYWFVTTAHLKAHLWFKDREDHIAGMNLVAVLAVKRQVNVVSFILMSNHVHFILEGSKDSAEAFIRRFKQMYALYYRRKYGQKELLRRNEVDIKEISPEDESLEKAVAYVLMNSVAANICTHPAQYIWGSGAWLFNENVPPCSTVGSMSRRAVQRAVHSKVPIPDNYLMDERGFISPASYIPTSWLESLFRTPKRLSFFLWNSSKAKKVKETATFGDQLLIFAMKDLCISLYKKNRIEELSEPQLAEILRQLRYRFSADPFQLSRVTELPYESVCKHLDTF